MYVIVDIVKKIFEVDISKTIFLKLYFGKTFNHQNYLDETERKSWKKKSLRAGHLKKLFWQVSSTYQKGFLTF